MKVKELIEELKKHHPEMEVAYEDDKGIFDINSIEENKTLKILDSSGDNDCSLKPISVVVLASRRT